MFSLRNIHTLRLRSLGQHDHEDRLGSFPKLRMFHLVDDDDDVAIITMKVWSEFIASSHTLENASVYLLDILDSTFFIECRQLVEAALSCSSLKTLSTNIPFLASSGTVSPNLVSIEFTCRDLDDETMFNCLCCIADMCKMPSMRSLEIEYYLDSYYPVVDKFLVILNHSLHCLLT